MSAAYVNQYIATQVNSATPEELLLMLYNGAIRFLTEAECAMAERRLSRQGELISKCIAIINELDATLDHEIGGQIAINLDALYMHMNRELLQANLKDDSSRLIRVKQLLIGLRDTWGQAIEQIHSEVAVGNGKNRQALETREIANRSASL